MVKAASLSCELSHVELYSCHFEAARMTSAPTDKHSSPPRNTKAVVPPRTGMTGGKE